MTVAQSTNAPKGPSTRWLVRPGGRWGTGLCLAVYLVAFAAVNAFWRYLAAGEWVNFQPLAYYHDLTTPLGEVFRYPLDVLTHPWMILVTGLLLGLVALVPLILAVLYHPLWAGVFVIVVALVGHAPVLALAVGIGCVVGGRSKLRTDMPFLSMVLGLLPTAAYFTLSALAGVDAAAVMPLQRWALYAPFLIAFVSAVLAGAIVLGLARLTGFRQVAVCPVLVGLLAGPAAAFYLEVGADELDYALIVNRSKAEQIQPGDAVFPDRALAPWIRRHGGEGLNPQTTRARVREDLEARRSQLVDHCREFLARHAESDRRAAVLWLQAQAASLQLDETALAVGLIRHTAEFPLPASVDSWRVLHNGYPAAPQAALADWRLGELALRMIAQPKCDDPAKWLRQADEHLHRAAEALRKLLPAAADRLASSEPPHMFLPRTDMPAREYYGGALDAVERLIWQMGRNATMTDPNSAEALGAYLDINPKLPDYYARLARLLSDTKKKREKTAMGDNLKLAIALQTRDVYERAEMLIQLAKDERTDAAIVANFELGKLALRTAEAPAIGLVEGLKTPEEYLRTVIAAPPNPYQQKAAQLLASLATRPKPKD